MNQTLQQFNGQHIRIVHLNDQPHFILADLCRVLELSNPRSVAARLDADEVSRAYVMDSMGRQQEAFAVNESGLYAVILRSDKPQARTFRKWVTNEVLPAIRQTGTYSAQPAQSVSLESIQRMADLIPQAIEARVQVAQAEVLAEMDARFAAQPINSVQKGVLHNAVRDLAQLMGGKPRDFRRAWTALKDHYGLAAYGDLQSNKFDDAMRFVRNMASAYESPRALEFAHA